MPCIGFLLCLNKGGSAMHRLPVVFKYKGTMQCIGFLLCLNKGGSAMHRLSVVFE